MVVHMIGQNMEYQLEMIDDYDQSGSRSFFKEVPAGKLRAPMSKNQLASHICQTLIDNPSRGFNR